MDPNKKLERKNSTETTGIDANTEFDVVLQLNVIPKTRHTIERSGDPMSKFMYAL